MRVSTTTRLVAAFSAVLAAFVAALVFHGAGLRRMEAIFGAMRAHEEQMRIALQIEGAVRDQYDHAGRFASGEGLGLAEYERARALARSLDVSLGELIEEPEAARRLEAIRAASAELDRVFRERIAPAADSRAAARAHEESFALVARIEQDVDAIFGQLQRASTGFRRELVAIHAAAERTAAAMLIAGPLLVAAAALYLTRTVARPLARLRSGAAALRGGDLGTRVEAGRRDEIGALAREFNAMTAALERQQARLVESEKLAGIGRLAAGVAHEVNNPLQVMLGYLSLHRDAKDPLVASDLALVELEVQRCREIVDDLLELARGPPGTGEVDLRALCDGVADALRVSMRGNAARLTVGGSGSALGDAPRLRQVTLNLVKNALEAAGPEGEVHVAVRVSGDTAEVAVRDSGPGVAAEARIRLFEPFFTTKASGKGLGLAVSRAIALAHGGDIDLGDGAPRGAVFTLRLPRAPEARS